MKLGPEDLQQAAKADPQSPEKAVWAQGEATEQQGRSCDRQGPGRCHKEVRPFAPSTTQGGSAAGPGPPRAGQSHVVSTDGLGHSDVETAEWPGHVEGAAQGRLQEPEHRRQATRERAPGPRRQAGGPASRLPALPARGATHTSASPTSSLTSSSNNLLQRRRGQLICDCQVLGVSRGAHPAERPKALGEDVPAKADGSSSGAGRAGAGVGMVQDQGGHRCSRTDGMKAVHEVGICAGACVVSRSIGDRQGCQKPLNQHVQRSPPCLPPPSPQRPS